jgi:hypothetical protein
MKFSSPPGWPVPPEGWSPPAGWQPQPDWPPAPEGWSFWTDGNGQPVDGPAVGEHEAGSGLGEPGGWTLWGFVVVQAGLIVLDIVLLRTGNPTLGTALMVGGVANLACLAADVTALRQAGYRVPVYLYVVGFLIVPLYLILRIRLTRQAWWPLVAWAGVFVVGVATPLTSYVGGVELDAPVVESSIEDWYSDEGGASMPVEVRCPSTLIVPVGDTFTCEVDGAAGGTEAITVTVESWLGDISWQGAGELL